MLNCEPTVTLKQYLRYKVPTLLYNGMEPGKREQSLGTQYIASLAQVLRTP
jgi:hypothetical protein